MSSTRDNSLAVVLCPMEIERAAVARAVRACGEGARIRVVRTGVGRERILHALDALLDESQTPGLIVLAGTCGGLAHGADVPTIARVVDEHGREWTRGVGFATADAAEGMASRGVALVGVDQIISTPADKAALARRTGAAIVDMESHAFAAACEARGAEWSVVRGVSDTPDETLPAIVIRWIRADGTTNSALAAWDLATHPTIIPSIIGVLRRSGRVLPKVGRAAVETIRAWREESMTQTGDGPRENEATRGPAAGARTGGATQTLARITPLPLDAQAGESEFPRDVVLMGGTFDPVHRGHVAMARAASAFVRERRGSQPAILFVPAARSPHKGEQPLAGSTDRVAMLRCACDELTGAAIWTDELDRARDGSASFTIHTLRRARAWLDRHGHHATRLHLMLGADQAAALHRWREPREILALASPLVMLREPLGTREALARALVLGGAWSDVERERLVGACVPIDLDDAASSDIRAELAASRGGATESLRLRAALHPKVLEYIRACGLYRGDQQRD